MKSDSVSPNTSKISALEDVNMFAMPVFAKEDRLEEEMFETLEGASNEKSQKLTVALPPPPPCNGDDNVSVVNSEVAFRNPQFNRQIYKEIYRQPESSLKHSYSTSDLMRLRRPASRNYSKDSKNMVLPVSPGLRSRSPCLSCTQSQSFEGLDFTGRTCDRSNPNLSIVTTAQDNFSPYIPIQQQSAYLYAQNDGISHYGHHNHDGITFSGDIETYNQRNKISETPFTISSSSNHHKLPTATETKKRTFKDTFSVSMSTIYAIFVVTLGVSVYAIDYLEIEDESLYLIAEGFSLTLLAIALLYLLFLNIDITIYNNKKKQFEKILENIQPEHMEMKETSEGVAVDVTFHKALTLKKQLDHRYCFNKDRHSSNFYLKIGAAGFCFGHLIHSVLILTFRGVILGAEEESVTSECSSVISFVIEIAYPIYSITLLFFIFKYSNVIINRNRNFHRFGFMHCLASSLCFWLWTIYRETAEYIRNSKYPEKSDNNITDAIGVYKPVKEDPEMVKIVGSYRFTIACEHDEMNVVYHNYSPYLYPFSVEYSILVVGIIYIVWINIGLCTPDDSTHEEHLHGEDTRECRNDRRASVPESNLAVHADCHASNKGLFGGFIVMVFAIVSLILFFITFFNGSKDLAESGLVINQSTRLSIITTMIIGVICAYYQMIKLDVNAVAHNSLDNFLCMMCLPAYFVHGLFSIIPGVLFGNVLAVLSIIFENIQVVLQTSFIIDGMSRSSNTKDLRKSKPGREFVIFLAICNVAMWIMQTFEVKSHGLDQYRQEFYSKELWSIVGHMCLPLMMFYRFHCSVCVVDIWKYAYMPSGH